MSKKKEKTKIKETTKIEEKTTTEQVDKLNKDVKKFKTIIVGMATVLTASVLGGGYLLVDKLNSDSKTETTADVTTYNTNIETAIKEAKKVKASTIDELVEKQAKGDYTLKTMIDTLGENPAYIATGFNVTYNSKDVQKLINDYTKKQSYKDSEDLITLVWIADNGKSITTYLATDMTDEVNVVGLFVSDDTLDITNVKTNENISKTTLKFEDFADVTLTVEELEDKVGELYHYSVQYPLLADSEVVKANSNEADIKATVTQSIFLTDTGAISVFSRENDVLSISDMPFDQKSIATFETDVIKKAQENEDLTRTEFLKTFEGATHVAVEESIEKEGDLFTAYLIKDKDDNVYTVAFEADKLSYFEGGEE